MDRKCSIDRAPRDTGMSAAQVALVASADRNVQYGNRSTLAFDGKIRNLSHIGCRRANAKDLP